MFCEQLRELFETQRYSTLETAVGHLLEDVRSLAATQDAEVYQPKAHWLGEKSPVLPPRHQFEDLIRQRIRERVTTLFNRLDIDEQTAQVVEDLLVSREIARVALGLDLVIAQPSSH